MRLEKKAALYHHEVRKLTRRATAAVSHETYDVTGCNDESCNRANLSVESLFDDHNGMW